MSGTDIGWCEASPTSCRVLTAVPRYALAMQCPVLTTCTVRYNTRASAGITRWISGIMVLRACDAMSGTDIAFGASFLCVTMRCPVLTAYAATMMPGTDIAYAASVPASVWEERRL
eukprot:2843557-Rhodomonas_salina.2